MPPRVRERLRELVFDYEVEFVSCRFFRNRAPWQLPRRTCPDTFLLFPVTGRVRARVGRHDRELAAGEYLMLADGCPHKLDVAPGVRRLHQISLHCRVQDRWNRPLLSRFRTPFGELPGDKTFWFESLLDLAALGETEPALAQAHCESLFHHLLAGHIRTSGMPEPAPAEGDPRVGRCLRLMEERLHSASLSVDELAGEVELSPVRLRQLFRRDTGTGPKEYLAHLRLRRAVRLLRDPANRVKTVAEQCGFSTDHYFHLVFRKAFGCTPSQYRRTSLM